MQFTEETKVTGNFYFYVTVESIQADLLSCQWKTELKKNQDFCKRFYHLYLGPLQTHEISWDTHDFFAYYEKKKNNHK